MADKAIQRSEHQRVHDALMHAFMDQLPILLSLQLFGAAILAYTVRDTGLFMALLWFALDVLLVGLSCLLVKYCRRYFNRIAFAYWVWFHLTVIVLLGSLWGATTLLFMDTSDPYSVVFHTILLLGVMSGALYSMSILPPMFYVFLISALTLYVFSLYAAVGFFEVTVASVVLGGAWVWVSSRMHNTIKSLFVEREKNACLLESLRQEKTMVERASRAKTRFLAAASHDLRQPLQAQRLFAEAIRSRAQDSGLRELGEHMVESQRAMQSMLDSLLNISQLDAGIVVPKPAPICLHDLFSNLMLDFTTLASEKGLAFHVHWPPRDAVVLCDQGLMESIIRNLLGNAIAYTEHGSVMLAARKRSDRWRIEVRDSGIGIAEDQQAGVFEEFRQLDNPERDRSKGLGLGLSIVQRLCRLLDYPLTLYSRLGQGTVFAFEVPWLPNHGEEVVYVLPQELNMEALLELQVLVVDDDSIVRRALQHSLSALGFTVHAAEHRQAALAVVQAHVPDVMIVDYRLPDQDTGSQLIEALRQSVGINVPAILLTGDTAPERLQGLHHVDYPVLHKPVSMHKLLMAMQDVSKPLVRSV